MAKINVSAGHNPVGMIACGAVGFIDESKENREVVSRLISILGGCGYDIKNCTCDNGNSQDDVINKVISACNARTAELDLQIHFNSSSNPNSQGCECWIYDLKNEKTKKIATLISGKLAAIGYKDRGVKESKNLAYLRRTKNPAVLVECCFVTNAEDCKLYTPDGVAEQIASAIIACDLGETVVNPAPAPVENLSWYTLEEFVKEVQSLTGSTVNGKAGAETLAKTVTISKTKNNRHPLVWTIQKRLTYLGYDVGTIDGKAGDKFHKALLNFQSKNGCVTDGEATAGKKTWKKLMEME